MTGQTINKPLTELTDLPESIRDWLGSENITYLIIELNKRLGFKDWKRGIIPDLVFDVTTRALPPENFISELSRRLEISYSSARIIAEEIAAKLLRPIETPLRTELNVDIIKITAGAPAGGPTFEMPSVKPPPPPPSIPPIAREIPKPPPLPTYAPQPRITPPPPPPPPKPQPPKSIPIPTQEKFIGEQPFIIHREVQTFEVPLVERDAPSRPKPPPISPQKPKQPQSMPSAKPRPTQTVVRKNEIKLIQKPPHENSPHKVVHYSDFRTKL